MGCSDVSSGVEYGRKTGAYPHLATTFVLYELRNPLRTKRWILVGILCSVGGARLPFQRIYIIVATLTEIVTGMLIGIAISLTNEGTPERCLVYLV
jgi:hypothetical protein